MSRVGNRYLEPVTCKKYKSPTLLRDSIISYLEHRETYNVTDFFQFVDELFE